MKRIYAFIVLLCLAGVAAAQNSTQNYVRTRTMLNDAANSYWDKTDYYDGLGRPFQTVQKNLVGLVEYDDNGREVKNWLPVYSTSNYIAPASFASLASTDYGANARPFTLSEYEPSAFDRVIRRYGPGQEWANKPAATEYLLNGTSAALSCINYTVSGNTLVNSGNYAAGQLYVTKSQDEDGHTMYSFTDKLGRVVLERQADGSNLHDTYYIYEGDNLRFVLPPAINGNISAANLNLYAYQYVYNSRNLLSSKLLPGAAAITYRYDKADKLIFSQDGNQKAKARCTFYLYDKQGRLCVQGECAGSSMGQEANVVVTAARVSTGTGLAGSGYSANINPASPAVYITNYYDDYSFRSITGFNDGSFPDKTAGAQGLLTASSIAALGSSEVLKSAYYYDSKGQLVKTVSKNLRGQTETRTTAYTFTGKPLRTTHTCLKGGTTELSEQYDYTYDNLERLTKVEHTLNGKKVTLAANTYDKHNLLSGKALHGAAANKLTYKYNTRSWLTEVAHTNFTQNLYYADGSNPVKCYNGNISSMTWKAADNVIRGYKFSYDNLNRMLNAAYGEAASLSTNLDGYTEKVTAYDKNGNILGLQRYGKTSATACGLIDNLTMTLNGNRLNRVEDAATASAYNGGFEFKNGASAAGEYAYDANGNLIKDLNKSITNIEYNFLNLPCKVTFSDGSTISYLYSADGKKLRTVHKIGSTTTTTDYCDNVVYENGVAKLLLTEEGYVSLNDKKYHYYLKDHQGNNRVVVNESGTAEETNHYYPFGGVFASTGNVQAYKFNGKELDTKKGLDWYDYGARQYDAVLGRWHVVDSSSEKYFGVSPYAYCNNSPVKNVDLDGRDWYMHNETGELYFNIKLSMNETNFNDRTYIRIGGNDMMGDMKDIKEKAYSFEESSSLAKNNGYSINPIQQIKSENSREQMYQTGKQTTTITTGKVEIVNEQYGIFSTDESRKRGVKTDPLHNPERNFAGYLDNFLTGGKVTKYIERNYYTYTKPTFGEKVGNAIGTVVGVMQIMTGTHDYRNVTTYKSWNHYFKATDGKGPLLQYKK